MSDTYDHQMDRSGNGEISAEQALPARETLMASLNDTLGLIVRRLRQQTARKAASYELAPAQYLVFQTIAFYGPRTMGDIVELTDYPASSLTSIVDRLTALDLVARSPHPTDRRAIQVRLTERGEELARRMEQDRRSDLELLMHDFSDEDIANFENLLRRLLSGMDRVDAHLTAQGVAHPRHIHEQHPEQPLPH